MPVTAEVRLTLSRCGHLSRLGQNACPEINRKANAECRSGFAVIGSHDFGQRWQNAYQHRNSWPNKVTKFDAAVFPLRTAGRLVPHPITRAIIPQLGRNLCTAATPETVRFSFLRASNGEECIAVGNFSRYSNFLFWLGGGTGNVTKSLIICWVHCRDQSPRSIRKCYNFSTNGGRALLSIIARERTVNNLACTLRERRGQLIVCVSPVQLVRPG